MTLYCSCITDRGHRNRHDAKCSACARRYLFSLACTSRCDIFTSAGRGPTRLLTPHCVHCSCYCIQFCSLVSAACWLQRQWARCCGAVRFPHYERAAVPKTRNGVALLNARTCTIGVFPPPRLSSRFIITLRALGFDRSCSGAVLHVVQSSCWRFSSFNNTCRPVVAFGRFVAEPSVSKAPW